jgi:hypothetical protein
VAFDFGAADIAAEREAAPGQEDVLLNVLPVGVERGAVHGQAAAEELVLAADLVGPQPIRPEGDRHRAETEIGEVGLA